MAVMAAGDGDEVAAALDGGVIRRLLGISWRGKREQSGNESRG
jgi:hypothetical protein